MKEIHVRLHVVAIGVASLLNLRYFGPPGLGGRAFGSFLVCHRALERERRLTPFTPALLSVLVCLASGSLFDKGCRQKEGAWVLADASTEQRSSGQKNVLEREK